MNYIKYITLFLVLSLSVFSYAQISNGDNPSPPEKTSISKASLKLYPNPTSDYFQIKSNFSIKKVEVYSILGNKIKEFSTSSSTRDFDIRDLDRGMYLVSVIDSKNKVVKTLRLSKQ